MALVFTAGVWATEITISTFDGVTPWTAFASTLGGLSVFSLGQWRKAAATETQEEWQPALMLRVLGGGLGFQAGVIGYFVANDVVGAFVGCGAFLIGLAYGVAALGSMSFDTG